MVYDAPREEKTWTVHSSCKLTPEPKARVANTGCGLANFIPVVRILFFAIPRPKTPHYRFGAGRECGTFGQGVAKIILMEIMNVKFLDSLNYLHMPLILSFLERMVRK